MARYRVLCEPRGFISILQIVFSLTTIIILASVSQKISVNLNCKPKRTGSSTGPVDREIVALVEYPFSFGDIEYLACGNDTKIISYETYNLSYSGQSAFFMSSLCFLFIYSLCRTLYYVFKESDLLYGKLPVRNIDYYSSIALALYNFIGVICCIVFVIGLQNNAVPEVLSKKIPECSDEDNDGYQMVCSHGRQMDRTDLMNSAILGVVNEILMAAMIWFTYKEVNNL